MHVAEYQFTRVRRPQREFPFLVPRGEALRIGGYEEPANGTRVGIVVGLRPDHRDFRRRAIGDPHLGAVQHPRAIALFPGHGDHASGIRAEVRFGQPETADRLAPGHLRKPGALLVLAAEREDGIHNECALHRRERPDAAVSPLELLHDQAVRDIVQARAAVFFGEVRAEDAQLRHLGNELFGEPGLDVTVADDREHPFIYPAANGVPDGALLFGQRAIDVEEVSWRRHDVPVQVGGSPRDNVAWPPLHGEKRRAASDASQAAEAAWIAGYSSVTIRSSHDGTPIAPPNVLLTPAMLSPRSVAASSTPPQAITPASAARRAAIGTVTPIASPTRTGASVGNPSQVPSSMPVTPSRMPIIGAKPSAVSVARAKWPRVRSCRVVRTTYRAGPHARAECDPCSARSLDFHSVRPGTCPTRAPSRPARPPCANSVRDHQLTTGSTSPGHPGPRYALRSEEHTSELQSPCNLVCRLLLEKKKSTRTSPRRFSSRRSGPRGGWGWRRGPHCRRSTRRSANPRWRRDCHFRWYRP